MRSSQGRSLMKKLRRLAHLNISTRTSEYNAFTNKLVGWEAMIVSLKISDRSPTSKPRSSQTCLYEM